MKTAVMDIGSNSVRLLVASFKGAIPLPLHKKLVMTRLGRGLVKDKLLDDRSMLDTLKALADFKDEALVLGCKKIHVFATSALREAENGPEFVREIRRQIGLDVDVISGEDEALFSFIGASHGLGISSKVLVVDIGGGSTELSLGENGVIKVESIPMGAVRWTNNYLKSDPPTVYELQEAEEITDEMLCDFAKTFGELAVNTEIVAVGVGGTLTTLAAVCQGLSHYDSTKVHGFCLGRDDVERLFFKLSALTVEERRDIPGLSSERADIIIAGTLIVRRVMEKLHLLHIRVSESDLMEGYLMDKINMRGDC